MAIVKIMQMLTALFYRISFHFLTIASESGTGTTIDSANM